MHLALLFMLTATLYISLILALRAFLVTHKELKQNGEI